MSQDEFTKLFKYMEEFRSEVNKQFEQTANKDDVRKIFDYLDGITKKQEISDDERLVMGHQLDRLNRWTQELADKIGHKLTA